MRSVIVMIAILILSWVATLLLPWWGVAVAAFLVALVAGQRPGRSFVVGFFGVGLFWLLMVILRDVPNEHILSTRMAALFHLPGRGDFILLTVAVGALVGGLSAWTGSLLSGK